MSIPKLEYQGTTLLAHVMIQVHLELPSLIHCWCDSMTVLQWLNGDGKKQEVFVRRRFEEVHKLVDVYFWYNLESKLNLTDILSRGL